MKKMATSIITNFFRVLFRILFVIILCISLLMSEMSFIVSFVLLSIILIMAVRGYLKLFQIKPILSVIVSILMLFGFAFFGIKLVVIFFGSIGILISIVIPENRVIAKKIKRRIQKTEELYFRDIPFEGDIFKIYYIADYCGLLQSRVDFLFALVLKWIREGKVELFDKNGDSNSDSILFSYKYYNGKWDNVCEKELYQLFFDSSVDGVLDKKEIKNLIYNKFSELCKWFFNISADERLKLTGNNLRKIDNNMNENIIEYGMQIFRLKRFLTDFTRLSERQILEVHLFEEYLMIAQMLGMAKGVMKQFCQLYNNDMENSKFNNVEWIFDAVPENTKKLFNVVMAGVKRTNKKQKSKM